MSTNAETQSSSQPAAGASGKSASPKKLGKYVIQRPIGAGGMGTVFLALDTELNRTVALKILPADRAQNPVLVTRFKKEGQAAARLEHTNIVKVYEAGEIDGRLFIALEYVDGIDVHDLVAKRKTLPVRRSIEIVKQVALALQHASEKGIVHRDIKPSNLMITRQGHVKLADMGLALAVDEATDTTITRAGMTVGTVDYMSPEQAERSRSADIRSDIYSLGCTWYHMLTGGPPYPNGSVTDKLTAHLKAPIPDPRQKNDRVPEAIVAVLQRMMAKRPADRYQTPAELLADLKQASLQRRTIGADVWTGLSEDSEDDTEQVGRALTDAPQAPSRTRPSKGKKPKAQRKQQRPVATDDDAPEAEADGEGEALPKKAKNPAALGSSNRSIDPDVLKYGFFGILAVVVIASVAWALSNLGGDTLEPQGAGANPYLVGDPQTTPQTTQRQPRIINPDRESTPPDADPVVVPASTVARDDELRPGDVREFSGAGVAYFEDVPRWVYEEREADRDGLPSVVVGRGGHKSLTDALSEAPKSGAIIKFNGRGPFEVPPTALEDYSRLVLESAGNSDPVLLLTGPTGFAIGSGHYVFHGLHLVATDESFDDQTALLRVTGGTLLVSDCSITLAGTGKAGMSAIAAAGEPSRCIIENCLIRGRRLAAVRCDGSSHEFVIGNSLFASGNAPTLDVSGVGGAVSQGPVTVRAFASTFAARAGTMRCQHAPRPAGQGVKFLFRSTLFFGDQPAAPWMSLVRWPESDAGQLEQPLASAVDLSYSACVWLGWPTLVAMTNPNGAPAGGATDATSWRQFWRQPAASDLFQVDTSGQPPFDHGRLTPGEINSRLLASLSDPRDVGALADDLPTPPQSVVERLMAFADRKRIPERFSTPPAAGTPIRFDLKRGLTLNDFLNSDRCPDGARVVLHGDEDKHVIDNVSLSGKSLRIEFDGDFIVEPAPRSGSTRPAALFEVVGGRLDLVGAHLRIPSSERYAYPERLVRVTDGSLLVQHCILQGQFRSGAQDVPTVEWLQTESGDPATQYALIEDSMVAGEHQAIGASLAGRVLELSNSVVVSNGDAIRTNANGQDAEGFLVVSDSTLSAGAAFFRFDELGRGRINVFVERSIYGPTMNPSAQGAVIAVVAPGDLSDQRVTWWESRTAYAAQIARYREAGATTQNTIDAWVNGWGADHVVHPLSGQKSVLFAKGLAEVHRAQPDDFLLSDSSEAATWGRGGTSVGADTTRTGPSGAAGETPSQPTAPRTQPRRGVPDF